ncbi:MAG: hypothetical protein KGJ51_08365, partial [Acidobacteriota bacterium]|nr:hypothetical protein [Acidobacteriota bacterium]
MDLAARGGEHVSGAEVWRAQGLHMLVDSAELDGVQVREVHMRSTHLVLIVLCGVALEPFGIAQAMTEAVQIDKTSVQAVG